MGAHLTIVTRPADPGAAPRLHLLLLLVTSWPERWSTAIGSIAVARVSGNNVIRQLGTEYFWGHRRFLEIVEGNLLDSSWIACRRSEQLYVVPEASQFADHLARAYCLGLGAHGGTTFLIADLLVENLPD